MRERRYLAGVAYLMEPSSQANHGCLLYSRDQHTDFMLDRFLHLETQISLALNLSVPLKFLFLSIHHFIGQNNMIKENTGSSESSVLQNRVEILSLWSLCCASLLEADR